MTFITRRVRHDGPEMTCLGWGAWRDVLDGTYLTCRTWREVLDRRVWRDVYNLTCLKWRAWRDVFDVTYFPKHVSWNIADVVWHDIHEGTSFTSAAFVMFIVTMLMWRAWRDVFGVTRFRWRAWGDVIDMQSLTCRAWPDVSNMSCWKWRAWSDVFYITFLTKWVWWNVADVAYSIQYTKGRTLRPLFLWYVYCDNADVRNETILRNHLDVIGLRVWLEVPDLICLTRNAWRDALDDTT